MCKYCKKETKNRYFCSYQCYWNGMRTGLVVFSIKGWSKGLTKETDARIMRISLGNMGRTSWLKNENKNSERYVKWLNAVKSGSKSLERRKAASIKTKSDWEGASKRKANQSWRMKKRRLWDDENFLKKWHHSRYGKPNKAESKLNILLQNNFPDMWKYTGDGKVVVGKRCPDFVNSDKNKVIELFGIFWHRKDSGKETELFYNNYNYNCMIVWEDELEDEKIVLERINNFILNGKPNNIYRAPKEDKFVEKKCVVCNKFFSGHINTLTCGKVCGYKMPRNHKEKKILFCKKCNKKVITNFKSTKKYCSMICRNESMKGKPFPNPYKPSRDVAKELLRRQKISKTTKGRSKKTLEG